MGNPRRLSELAGGDPLLLQFYRGWFCPKERQFFRRLVDLQDDAEVAYARFVSISVEPSPVQAAFRAGLDELLAMIDRLCDEEPDTVASSLANEVAGATGRADDVCVLALRLGARV